MGAGRRRGERGVYTQIGIRYQTTRITDNLSDHTTQCAFSQAANFGKKAQDGHEFTSQFNVTASPVSE
jgi:hypothetical protein